MKPLFLYTLMIAVLCLTGLCWAQTTVWRVSSRISESMGIEYAPQVPEGYTGFTDRVEETINYQAQYPGVLANIQSRRKHTGANGDGFWHEDPQVLFTSTVSNQPNYHNVWYYFGNGTWYKQRVETKDDFGRLQHLTITDGNIPPVAGKRYHFYYDEAGRLESITTATFYQSNSSFSRREMQYDAQGRKIGEMVYSCPADSTTWVQDRRITIWQSGESFPPGTAFKLSSALFDVNPTGYSAGYDLMNMPGLTETGIVDSVHVEEYIDNEWRLTYRDIYEVQVADDGIISYNILSWYLPMVGVPDYLPGYFTFSFAPHGGFLGYSFSYDDGLSPPSWGSVSYIWEHCTESGDPVAPPQQWSFSAFPNPFRDKLSICSDADDRAIARIDIYNLRGQLIRRFDATEKVLDWDGKDGKGYAVPAGIYIIKRISGDTSTQIKVLKY